MCVLYWVNLLDLKVALKDIYNSCVKSCDKSCDDSATCL